jgi:hypothetical protein
MSPLLRDADGGHTVQLQLAPQELGTVRITIDVRHGEVAMHLHASDASARDLLREHLPDLRDQLEEQGLRAGNLDVGQDDSGASQWSAQQRSAQQRALPRTPAPGAPEPVTTTPHGPRTAAPGSGGALDLRM